MSQFLIKGGKKLKGEITLSGSKNAALPILAACLLTDEPCTLKNVPDIADVWSMLHLLELLGAKVHFQNNTAIIHAARLKKTLVHDPVVNTFRASILLLGPLLSRLGEAHINFPGGCILGKRSIFSHLYALKKLGGHILSQDRSIHIQAKKLRGDAVIMAEISVTATENAIMASVLSEGTTVLRLAASEPHVEDLCRFLNKMGARIRGVGTHTLVIHGVRKLRGTGYRITSDYLEAGTLALASLLTHGNVTIRDLEIRHLDAFWNMLDQVGAHYELHPTHVTLFPTEHFSAVEKLRTAVHPSFPTDLQAPFSVLLTQAQGVSSIFETLFEGRLNHLFELEKMGAKVEILNPHQARIHGPTPLKACPVASCDIRAGTAMVLAALVAQGTTEISNIYYIDRGYEGLDAKLRALGAEIQRKD